MMTRRVVGDGMHKILISVVATALFAAPAQAAKFEGEDHSYASLLLSTEGADVAMAARALARHRSVNSDVFDLAANMLWLACASRRSVAEDAQVSLAAALGSSRTARYRDVLGYCADRARQPQVRSSAEAALGTLPAADAAQFPGGTIRLYDVATQLSAAVARDAARRPAGAIAGIGPGQSLRVVYQRLGLPDMVAADGDGIVARYGDNAVPFVLSAGSGWQVAGAVPAPAPAPPPVAAAPPPAAPPPAAVITSPPATPPAPPPVPPPAPVAAPVVSAPPPAATPVVPAKSAFTVGQTAKLRAGAKLRARPLAGADVPAQSVSARLTLMSSTRNAYGRWWYVAYQNKTGWVLDSDLAPN